MLSRWPLLTAVLLCALPASNAEAGCENLCDLSVQPAVVDPALSCLALRVEAQTCGCAVTLKADNSCKDTLGFSGDSLRSYCCSPAWQADTTCNVPARSSYYPKFSLHDVGRGDWSFVVQDKDQAHTVTIAYEVTSFDNSCFASLSGARRASPWTWATLALVLGVIRLRRRRRARAPF